MLAELSLALLLAAPATPAPASQCALHGSGDLPGGLVFARGAVRPFAKTSDFRFAHELVVQLPTVIAQKVPVQFLTNRTRLDLELRSESAFKARVRAAIQAHVFQPTLGSPVELRFSAPGGAMVRLIEPELFRPASPLEVVVPCGSLELGRPSPQPTPHVVGLRTVQLRGDEVALHAQRGGAAAGVVTDEPYATLLAVDGVDAHVRIESLEGVLEGWVPLSETSAVEGAFGGPVGALDARLDADLRTPDEKQQSCSAPVELRARAQGASWAIGRLLPGTPFKVVQASPADTVIDVQLDGLELLPDVELVLDGAAWKACQQTSAR